MRLFLAFLVATLGAAAQDQAAAQNNCAIDGTVVNRVTHEPVPRVKLVLMLTGATYQGAADNSGHWTFTGIRCGNASVLASRFGYLDTQQSTDTPPSFFLTPDEPAHATIEIMPQSVITGKVVDENGDPIMGMRVVPYFARVLDGKRQLLNAPQAVTDDLGQFRIPRLEPGKYVACAMPATGETTFEESCYPAPIEAGVSSAMRVAPGQETEVDFALTRIRTVRVSGTLTGLPAGAGASVELARAGGRGLEPRTGAGVSPDGSFTIPAVAPGSYTLTSATRGPDQQPLFARMPLEVGSTNIDNLSVALQPPINVPGSLRFDAQNVPSQYAERLQILLRSSERNGRSPQVQFGGEGRSFTLLDVLPGSYSLSASLPGYFLERATLGGQDVMHAEFEIDSGAGTLELVLSDKAGSLEGDVVMDDGSPASDAVVILLRDGELVRNFRVDNGHFNQTNLPPGDYAAYAWDTTRNVEYADPEWMKQFAGAGTTVTIAAGQNAQIRLTRQTAPSGY